jgi:nitroreductase
MYGHPEFDLFEAIYTTRAMRRLKPDPVPREIIMRIIEAATMAPSNSNRQPWMFMVVTAANIQHTVRYTELSPQRFKDFWKD